MTTKQQKPLGQIAYEADREICTMLGVWRHLSTYTQQKYAQIAQAVAREVRAEYGATAIAVTHKVRRRKAKA